MRAFAVAPLAGDLARQVLERDAVAIFEQQHTLQDVSELARIEE
jgi:hypothetical protein